MEPFPYKKEHIDPHQLWENAVNLDLAPLQEIPLPDLNTNRSPSWRSIPRKCKWEYQGKILGFVTAPDMYDKVNKLGDFFSEEARMKASRKGYLSPYDFYHQNYDLVVQEAARLEKESTVGIQPHRYWLREALYLSTVECTTFKIAVSKSLFKFFQSKKVLDPSSGWGDRLLGAAAAGVEVYHGVDANSNLQSCYAHIFEFLTSKGTASQYKMMIGDFLEVTLDQQYDTVFTSPPFFDYELYSEDSAQSYYNRPTLNSWMTEFFYPYLEKAWSALQCGGHFALYVNDTKNVKYVHDMCTFITDQLGGTFLGILAITNQGFKYGNPIWVWKK